MNALGFLKDIRKKREERKLLLMFYSELAKNLETFYVHDQRGTLGRFGLEVWIVVKQNLGIILDEKIIICQTALDRYNAIFDDFIKYEQWYISDIKNKTTENSRQLHEKKQHLKEEFQGLLPIIKTALEQFKNQLIALNFIQKGKQ